MPGRKIPLTTDSFYHVYNRGVAKMRVFANETEYKRMTDLINYYRFVNLPCKYSAFLDFPSKRQQTIMDGLYSKSEVLVYVHVFVLMPNHFHFLLEQKKENGISKFMADVTNGLTKYINIKKDRVGPLFQGTFKSVLIETNEQFIHVSRYIHLNPYTDKLVNSIGELLLYPYSSLPNYCGKSHYDFVRTETVMSDFKDKNAYQTFVLNQRDYQRKIGLLKKLVLEKMS